MNIKCILMISLLTLTAHTSASEQEKIQAQQNALKQEIQTIQKEALSEQERLEALKRLIDTQREENSRLDKEIEAEVLRQQSNSKTAPLKE
ncbi:MAG: DUF3450 domain-containing protein [Sedimenticola sp.]|nr:DUF3450 domain-containing protein [Sedimenticola sp.]